jgi:hypothetical protein
MQKGFEDIHKELDEIHEEIDKLKAMKTKQHEQD